MAFPDSGPERFALNLVLRNADVQKLTREKSRQLHGDLNVSLSLEGAWNDPASRRGRGDVVVTGHDLYQIPLMMGLLQITNLSLPISSPFNEATARYSVEGQRVNFESIALKSKSMVMQGAGTLDYASKKISLTFTTDNPNGLKLPLIDELLTGARHELLQIHVTGAVEKPKVSASMMDTITTTVDQVTRGGK